MCIRDRGNSRTLLSSYEQERGAMLVDGSQVARSEKAPSGSNVKYVRNYPQGPLYSHVTGWFSLSYGAGGLELAEDDLLSGQSDALFYRRLGDLLTGKRATGVNLDLTIDARTQPVSYTHLDVYKRQVPQRLRTPHQLCGAVGRRAGRERAGALRCV